MSLSPNRDDLADYLDFIFGYIEPEGTCIALRGTGEKGTSGEGAFIDPVIVPMVQSSFDVDRIFGHVQRWSQYGRASFIVPASVDAAAFDGHATEDRICAFTTIVVDIDRGDTKEKLEYAARHLGKPSMVVHSGGFTETLSPKVHAYWKLSEATEDIGRLVVCRRTLALKLGGDVAFGRSTQVIRLPGSIYAKGDIRRLCKIADRTQYEYELDDLEAAIVSMDVMPGVEVDPAKLQGNLPVAYSMPGGGLNFSGFKDVDNSDALKTAFTTDIAEGGDADRNRWNQFSMVAGKNIASVRQGILSVDEAKTHTHTWMMEHMSPPWPLVRFESEWKALVAHDVKAKGPMPGERTSVGQVVDAVPQANGSFAVPQSLTGWAASQWTQSAPPKRKFLVKGLILAGKSHLLAAEGGAGKTMMLLELALKMTTHEPGMQQEWCGQPLTDDAAGTVVILTTEDDKDELHIRLSDLDPENRRARTGDRLIVIPTINIGGAFPLCERERGTGRMVYGARWEAFLKELAQVRDLKMVVIDTMNTTLHGEENNATVINEYIQAASAEVCGKMGAALVITHHVRKPGAQVKIYTAEDMKNSIRGSTAIIGAFRVALGIWHAPDFKERLSAMGREPHPGQLYNFAVVKANNPEMSFGLRSMLRDRSGRLADITEQESKLVAGNADQTDAWMVKAVAYAAEKGHPFTVKSAMKKPPNGRKHQLPALLQTLPERRLKDLLDALVADGRIVQCNPKGSKTYNHLDVSDGPLARAVGLDGGAYKIEEGADFTPPSWEHLFEFHPVTKAIVRRGEAERTMIRIGGAHGCTVANGGSATGASDTGNMD